jgi:hypothetical protein
VSDYYKTSVALLHQSRSEKINPDFEEHDKDK